MATPRKHWFKVPDSILWDGWTDSEVATCVRLQAYMNTRWARDGKGPLDAGSVTLDLAAARLVCRRTHRADCERALRALEARLTLYVSSTGESFEVRWPKWPFFQGIATRELPESRPRAALSETQTQTPPQTPTQKKRESAPSAPAAAPRRPRSGSAKIPRPDSFTGEARDRIRRWAAEKGYDSKILNDGLERFREWAPLKAKHRDIDQWVGAFMRVVREGVEKGQLVPASKANGGASYRDADQVLAEAKRKQAEDDARQRELESPDEIGNLIDLALHREVAS